MKIGLIDIDGLGPASSCSWTLPSAWSAATASGEKTPQPQGSQTIDIRAHALLSESGQRGSSSLEVVFESFLKSKPAGDYHQL
jgi:hypothetical protein